MTRDQRLQESILMKERWSVIQSGTSRKNIRIRGNCLYVCGKLHGRVSNLKFVHVAQGEGVSLLDHPNSPRRIAPIVQQDQQSDHHVYTTPVVDESTASSVDYTCPQHSPPASANDNPTCVIQTSSTSTTSEPQPNLPLSQSRLPTRPSVCLLNKA